jgi:hypothetical protein
MTVDNKFIIAVSIPDYKAVFQNFDFTTAFYKRDLNDKLVQHIFECVAEIGVQNDFIIRFDLSQNQRSESEENDIVFSFKNYFDYLISLNRRELRSVFSHLMIHFGIAGFALLAWLLVADAFSDSGMMFYQFFMIGLPVAVWVLILTALSRFLFRIRSRLAETKMCNKIRNSPIEFNYSGD